jgi:hypothetical protein
VGLHFRLCSISPFKLAQLGELNKAKQVLFGECLLKAVGERLSSIYGLIVEDLGEVDCFLADTTQDVR